MSALAPRPFLPGPGPAVYQPLEPKTAVSYAESLPDARIEFCANDLAETYVPGGGSFRYRARRRRRP